MFERRERACIAAGPLLQVCSEKQHTGRQQYQAGGPQTVIVETGCKCSAQQDACKEASADRQDDLELTGRLLAVRLVEEVENRFDECAYVTRYEGRIVVDGPNALKASDLYGSGEGDQNNEGLGRKAGWSASGNCQSHDLDEQGRTVSAAGVAGTAKKRPANQDAGREREERNQVAHRLLWVVGEQRDSQKHGVARHSCGEDVAMQDPDDGVEHASTDRQQDRNCDVSRCGRQRLGWFGLGKRSDGRLDANRRRRTTIGPAPFVEA